ncbi:MAG TPA: hypothetical protein VE775_07320 [Pyrinomonadaceae bacterium]|nr:hypothetical protein [Pyrinomonadaceae bacterium]
MPDQQPMICPDCGVAMNHHADKLDYDAAQADSAERDFDGVLVEAHTCPACGRTHTRPAGAAA